LRFRGSGSQEALALIDVRVLDHFIVGEEVVSMAERGLM